MHRTKTLKYTKAEKDEKLNLKAVSINYHLCVVYFDNVNHVNYTSTRHDDAA
jgi:hypothetical protein